MLCRSTQVEPGRRHVGPSLSKVAPGRGTYGNKDGQSDRSAEQPAGPRGHSGSALIARWDRTFPRRVVPAVVPVVVRVAVGALVGDAIEHGSHEGSVDLPEQLDRSR